MSNPETAPVPGHGPSGLEAVRAVLRGVPRNEILITLLVLGVLWAPPTIAADGWPRTGTGVVLAALTGAALMLRGRLPVAATAVSAATTLLGTVAGVCQDPMLATAWCLYPVAVSRGTRTRGPILALIGSLAGLVAVTGVASDAPRIGAWLLAATAALCAAWLVGTAVGRQIAVAGEAERMRVQLEVAREVHDVVGHTLGVIAAEAAVTRELADASPTEIRETLAGVESHAREALEEMQELVRSLRASPTGPAAINTLNALPAIIASTRAAGVAVQARLDLRGPVDAEVGAALVRITQEALSNVVRHAPGARCDVELRKSGDKIALRVRDSGGGSAPMASPGTGFGLPGMRERARALGGTVTWSGTAEGGFEIEARLPTGRSR